jgi:hypothetical protein
MKGSSGSEGEGEPKDLVSVSTSPSRCTQLHTRSCYGLDAVKASPAGAETRPERPSRSWREAQEAWRSNGFRGATAQPHPPPTPWQSTISACRTRSPSAQAGSVHSANPPSGCTTSVPWQCSIPASQEAHSMTGRLSRSWTTCTHGRTGKRAGTALRRRVGTTTRPRRLRRTSVPACGPPASSSPASRPRRTPRPPPKRTVATSSRRPHWPAAPPSGPRRRPWR